MVYSAGIMLEEAIEEGVAQGEAEVGGGEGEGVYRDLGADR